MILAMYLGHIVFGSHCIGATLYLGHIVSKSARVLSPLAFSFLRSCVSFDPGQFCYYILITLLFLQPLPNRCGLPFTL